MRLPAAAGLVGAATIQGRPVAFTACCTLPAQQMQGSCCSPGLQHAFLAVSYAPLWSLSYRCLLARSPGDRALQEARHLASSARRQPLRQALALQGPALSELYHCPLPIPFIAERQACCCSTHALIVSVSASLFRPVASVNTVFQVDILLQGLRLAQYLKTSRLAANNLVLNPLIDSVQGPPHCRQAQLAPVTQ